MAFVAAAARLRAGIYGIPIPPEAGEDVGAYMKKVVGDVIVPDFSPQVCCGCGWCGWWWWLLLLVVVLLLLLLWLLVVVVVVVVVVWLWLWWCFCIV
jgi:hypothetical protein